MQNKELNNNREAINTNISRLNNLGKSKSIIWKNKLRNRSI